MYSKLFIACCCVITVVYGHPAQNITITVPEGTTQHGDRHLLCRPTKWSDIILFYLINYGSHAITVKSLPGETFISTALTLAYALLFPYSGVLRGIEAIWKRGIRDSDHLRRAARSGALCLVIRSFHWTPAPNQDVEGVVILGASEDAQPGSRAGAWSIGGPEEETAPILPQAAGQIELDPITAQNQDHPDMNGQPAVLRTFVPINVYGRGAYPVVAHKTAVHGLEYLPPEFELLVVPPTIAVMPNFDGESKDLVISCSYNVPKHVIAIAQVIFGCITLYHTRGEQLRLYGYAAFGLTVIPYVIMSIINLAGNLTTPEYPTMYLVHSPELVEAKERGAKIDGIVGKVVKDSGASETRFIRRPLAGKFVGNKEEGFKFQQFASQQPAVSMISESDSTTGTSSNRQEQYPRRITRTYTVAPARDPNAFKNKLYVPACSSFRTQSTSAKSADAFGRPYGMTLSLAVLPYAILGIITRFQRGQSTLAQRIWTMFWLSADVSVIPFWIWIQRIGIKRLDIHNMSQKEVDEAFKSEEEIGRLEGFGVTDVGRESSGHIGVGIMIIPFVPLAIGGFVVVAQMLQSYGSCTRLD